MAVELNSSFSEPLRFLYQLKEGPTEQSFGVYVAQMAGLPVSVIGSAWQVLKKLENPLSGGTS
jgi:DNA mismatch repair ATPase MutS